VTRGKAAKQQRSGRLDVPLCVTMIVAMSCHFLSVILHKLQD